MSTRQKARLAVLPLLPIALGVLAWLGFVAIRESILNGGGVAWLMAWVLAFLVGMPLLVLGLAVAGAAQRHTLARDLVPYSGETIPGAGQ
ncbi:MAG TPA: hypothetical protein VJW16_02810 [Lysobacter sp.]|jgi:hypothetical protein|nr:hypothetical protein [Lysobacter sp.]